MFGWKFDDEDPDQFWRLVFELCYSSQGSGLGMSYADVLDLPLDRMIWLYEQLTERRREEARAVRSARK